MNREDATLIGEWVILSAACFLTAYGAIALLVGRCRRGKDEGKPQDEQGRIVGEVYEQTRRENWIDTHF